MQNTYDCDVAVVGGGPVGLTLALALTQAGFRCAQFDSVAPERFRDPAFDGRAYAISLASRRLLTGLEIWPQLAGHAQRIDDIIVADGRVSEGASPLFLRFSRGETDSDGFGHMLEDRWLRGALLDRAEAAPGLSFHAPCRIQATRPEGTGITVEAGDGFRLRARLAAACDGRRSPAAERAGITRTGWRYDQTAIVCAVRHEKPHRGIAYEYFLPTGPFAILPLPGNVSSIVWTEDREIAGYLRQAGEAVVETELRRRFGEFLGRVELCSGCWFYPLDISLADHYVSERLALVGDAAHRIHPLAGQGMNVGFADAAALVEVLTEARARGEDIGALDVLERYQARRRFDATMLAFATDGLDRLFSSDRPGLRLLRDLGMAAVGRSGPLRRFFAARAAGVVPH